MSLSTSREQRWLQWRNVDISDTPICPAYGCVEIVGYENLGANIILQGRSAVCFDDDFSTHTIVFSGNTPLSVTFSGPNIQGARWPHAFNGPVSVNPGEIGHVTFDLPTWAATVNHEGIPGYSGTPGLSIPLFMGRFYDTQNIRVIPNPIPSQPDLYTLGIAVIGARWRIGAAYSVGYPANFNPGLRDPGRAGNSLLYRGGEAGWNCLHYDTSGGNGHHKAWVGGTRTFLQHPNRQADA